MKNYIFLLALFLSTNTFASIDTSDLTEQQELCYAKAMIGFDFVINSRLGVKPENGVRLVGHGTRQAEFYLESILGAYLWKDTPHEYAVKTFIICLTSNKP